MLLRRSRTSLSCAQSERRFSAEERERRTSDGGRRSAQSRPNARTTGSRTRGASSTSAPSAHAASAMTFSVPVSRWYAGATSTTPAVRDLRRVLRQPCERLDDEAADEGQHGEHRDGREQAAAGPAPWALPAAARRRSRARSARCTRPSAPPPRRRAPGRAGRARWRPTKNSSSLKKPSVSGSAASVAAAMPLATASTGSRRPRPAEAREPRLAGRHGDRTGGHEQGALRDRVGEHVERGSPGRGRAADPVERDHVAVLRDRRVGEDLLQLVLRQREHAPDRDRDEPDDEQHVEHDGRSARAADGRARARARRRRPSPRSAGRRRRASARPSRAAARSAAAPARSWQARRRRSARRPRSSSGRSPHARRAPGARTCRRRCRGERPRRA